MRKAQFQATLQAMILWNLAALAKLMAENDLANANQLATFAKITTATTYKTLSGARLEKIDAETLERLAFAFDVEPWTLLEYSVDPDRKR